MYFCLLRYNIYIYLCILLFMYLYSVYPVILGELRNQGWSIFLLNEELKNPRILKITGLVLCLYTFIWKYMLLICSFLLRILSGGFCCAGFFWGNIPPFVAESKSKQPKKWDIHPRRLTWNLRMHPSKRKIIFQTIIFRCTCSNLTWLLGPTGGVFLSNMPWTSKISCFLLSVTKIKILLMQ